jgi:hypothetical protein
MKNLLPLILVSPIIIAAGLTIFYWISQMVKVGLDEAAIRRGARAARKIERERRKAVRKAALHSDN